MNPNKSTSTSMSGLGGGGPSRDDEQRGGSIPRRDGERDQTQRQRRWHAKKEGQRSRKYPAGSSPSLSTMRSSAVSSAMSAPTSSPQNSASRRRRWGGPGILFTCETGLERKCRHQAAEILQHYYEQDLLFLTGRRHQHGQPQHVQHTTKDETETTEGSSAEPESKKARLTLDAELALLRQEGQRRPGEGEAQDRCGGTFPFAVHETKCRGTVTFLCTSTDRFLASPSSSSTSFSSGVQLDAASETNPSAEDRSREFDDTIDDALPTEPCPQHYNASNEPPVGSSGATDHTSFSRQRTWDPLCTVLSVVRDARTSVFREKAVDATSETNDDDNDNDNDALFPSKNLARHRDSRNGGVRSSHVIPSSRFVTRMIPLQITCYAAIEEIAAAFRSLLEWHLQASRRARDSDRRDANRDRSIPSSSLAAPVVGTKESTDAPGAATSSTGTIASPAAEHVEPLTAEATSRATTTYMIQSKRRHCDNVRSHDVIERVAGLVPDDWKVDLKSPDVVVWVEICSTLAGLSIVPSVELREAYHFNLLRARTATAEDEPSLSRARAAKD